MKKAVVIGGGFAGCTASLMLKEKGFDVTIIEATSVLGGGCRTYFYHGHPYTYGPHHLLIDVNDKKTWNYFNSFLFLRTLKHKTKTYVGQDNSFYDYPIHEDDISVMPDKDKIIKELSMREDISDAKNFEEYWVKSVGHTLYNKFINSYSNKMWQIDDNKVIDEYSFSPKGVTLKKGSRECFEGQKIIAYPREFDGYNSYFDKCVDGCNVIYNVWVKDFDLENKKVKVGEDWIYGDVIVSTASIDSLFNYSYGELPYIGRDFLKIILPIERITPEGYYFIHYAGDEPYTRIMEYKLLTGYKSSNTLIIIETPSRNNKLYPYPIKSEIQRAKKYLDDLPEDVYSIGRLGHYRYDNMVMVLKDCFDLSERLS